MVRVAPRIDSNEHRLTNLSGGTEEAIIRKIHRAQLAETTHKKTRAIVAERAQDIIGANNLIERPKSPLSLE